MATTASEWFIQATDEIIWDVEDGETGRPRAKVTMKAGDVAAMPADIRHKGYSPKALDSDRLGEQRRPPAADVREGRMPPYPVEF